MSGVTLLAIACSAAVLLLIGRRDPKRLRAAGRCDLAPYSAAQRRGLAAAALLPGLLLALAGQSAGVVIWLGASVALGWLLTQMLAAGVAGRGKVRR
ncbi:hypothetical protein [Solimonas flava]|uniref:hypothetical protein n=1 Tax=Solimonas flava TaxID=415849 RepID=UPI0003F631F9|nr:hypothetical protein [Solimonas flava]